MTGFGSAACEVLGRRLLCEIRSVNHRFFDVKIRLPWSDAVVDGLMQQALRKRIERGALTVVVTEDAQASAPRVRVNVPLAQQYQQSLTVLAQKLGLPATISLDLLVALGDIVTVGEPERTGAELFEALRPALERAMDDLGAMRQREGAVLAGDLRTHAARIETLGAEIAELAQNAPEMSRKRLEERLARVLTAGQVDPQRLAQEVAIFADRADISEEIVRLSSHLAQVQALCNDAGAVGRKLEFLLQEVNREVNTIGSKAQSAAIAQRVVEAKATLEKMREQVQNVE